MERLAAVCRYEERGLVCVWTVVVIVVVNVCVG
jgi:hypothetical protein